MLISPLFPSCPYTLQRNLFTGLKYFHFRVTSFYCEVNTTMKHSALDSDYSVLLHVTIKLINKLRILYPSIDWQTNLPRSKAPDVVLATGKSINIQLIFFHLLS